MMQFFSVLLFAPLVALVPIHTMAPVPVLFRVRLRSVPPEVDPSIVTLSAPLILIRPADPMTAPVTVRTPPLGLTVREVHELTEGSFKTADVAPSFVSQAIVTVMLLPAWVPLALRAVKAAPSVT